jgi:hypothetical protein
MPRSFDIVGFLRQVRNGILGVLEISEEKGSGKPASPYIQWATVFISTVQMLSFVTASLDTSPWPPSLSPIETISSLTNLRGCVVTHGSSRRAPAPPP